MTLPGVLEHSIEAALRFLLASQSTVGYWSDWHLPPGESRMWTTAYVGYRLSTVPPPARDLAQRALRPAAAWLASSEFPDGGWGYSEEVGPDGDSTALAILFLSSQRARVSSRSYRRLRTFQREDGGYATYTVEQSFGTWVSSHPDVTAVVVPALLTRYEQTEPFVARAVAYAIAQATPEGLWSSYWWSTPLYATEAYLHWLALPEQRCPAGRTCHTLLRMQPRNAFETALLVLCLLHAGCATEDPAVAAFIGALLDAQLSDGSWPSQPILRLPPRDRDQTWTAPESAPLFADQHRTFTSATVIAALSAASTASDSPGNN